MTNPGELSQIKSLTKLFKFRDRKKRSGYISSMEGKLIYTSCPLSSFIASTVPFVHLASYHKFTLPFNEKGEEDENLVPKEYKE